MIDVSSIPERFKSYALVIGEISSAPLDLMDRMQGVYDRLRLAGWLVFPRSIGTDFRGPLGLPIPKTQPIELYLHKRDQSYTKEEAELALSKALHDASMEYHPIESWMAELHKEIIQPTLQQTGSLITKKLLPYVAVAGGIVLAVMLLMYMPRRRS